MAKYRTPKGRVMHLHGTPDEHADALEEKLRAIRDRERQGDHGESRVFTKGLEALPQGEIDLKDKSWDRLVQKLLRDVRGAVKV
jgi:hypothetical protein